MLLENPLGSENETKLGVQYPAGAMMEFFSLRHRIQIVSGVHLSSYPVETWGGGVLYLRVKRPGHEADHSPPSSADVKNAWNYTST
jgi:hypothetical protein